MPNQEDRRVSKILRSTVSKAADRSRRQRQEIFREPMAFLRLSCMYTEQFQWSDVYSKQTGEDLPGC